jgi:ribosomal protein S18 acetylase RimI-like enzyme
MVSVRAPRDDERVRVNAILVERWGAPIVVSRGVRHDMRELPTLVADEDGEIAGVLTYAPGEHQVEVVSIDALRQSRGIGTALLDAVVDVALANGWRRLWLITTNDNTRALRFYQRRGWDLVAVHRGAIGESRRLKPQIPQTGDDDIPIKHELELELVLTGGID